MRPTVIAGLVIACLGAFVLLRGASYTSQKNVVKVGDVSISAEEKRSIPPWVGWTALVVGLGLAGSGLRSRTGGSR